MLKVKSYIFALVIDPKSLNLTIMYSTKPKKENQFILFTKYFVLPLILITIIVFVIKQFKSYAEMDAIIKKTEIRTVGYEDSVEVSPRISSISKGMDRK